MKWTIPIVLGAVVAVWQITGNEADSVMARAVIGVGGYTIGLIVGLAMLVRELRPGSAGGSKRAE